MTTETKHMTIHEAVLAVLRENPGSTKEKIQEQVEHLLNTPVSMQSLRLADLGLDGKIKRDVQEIEVVKQVKTKQKVHKYYLA